MPLTPLGASSFDGVPFQIDFGNGFVMRQVPKLRERNADTHPSTLFLTIGGRTTVQENDVHWKPVVLEFSVQNMPAALATQAMVDAFVAGKNAGGLHTLVLEGVTHKVYFDPRVGKAIALEEVTPTGEGNDFENQAGPAGRLYSGSVFFIEVLP